MLRAEEVVYSPRHNLVVSLFLTRKLSYLVVQPEHKIRKNVYISTHLFQPLHCQWCLSFHFSLYVSHRVPESRINLLQSIKNFEKQLASVWQLCIMMTVHWLLKPCPQVRLHSFSWAKLTAHWQNVSLSPVFPAQLVFCYFSKLNWHTTQLNKRWGVESSNTVQLGMDNVIPITVAAICSINSVQSMNA